MRSTLRSIALLLPPIVALVAASILLVDYVRPEPVFCAEGGGCQAIHQTAWARPFGVPMPVFGVLGAWAHVVLALLAGKRVRVAQLALAIPGALLAALLIAIQALMGAFCKYCMVFDASILVLAVVAVARASRGWDLELAPKRRRGALLAALAAFFGPLAVGAAKAPPPDPPLPDFIAAEHAKAPPGVVTVVDFADFECPWCRLTHETLAPLLAQHGARVQVVRKYVPLVTIHPHAMFAARAGLCAHEQGKGPEMEEALFAAADLTPSGCEREAKALGLDLAAYRACVASARTEARIDADKDQFRASGARGLPTLYIGTKKLEGAQTRESLERALDRALRKAAAPR